MAVTTNKDYVTAGKPAYGGSAYTAAAGTTLPTDAVTALSAEYIGLGYISEDGLSNNGERDTTDIKAWGGDIVLNIQNEKTDEFTVTFIEALNPEVLKLVHGGDNVSGTLADGLTVKVNSKELEERVMVFDMIMNGDVLKRVVIPKGKIVSVGEVKYSDDEAVGYECTIKAFPSTDLDGDTHREYIVNKPAVTDP